MSLIEIILNAWSLFLVTLSVIMVSTTEQYSFIRFALGEKDNLYLSCNKCGKTISTNCETTNSFIAHIFKSHGFNIDKNLSTIYGLCKECE